MIIAFYPGGCGNNNAKFDFAWDMFEKYGAQAPIIDEWEKFTGLKNFHD